MLAGKFQKAITGLGMERLEHPLFYHAPVGIRFEIGGEEPIYLDRSAAKLKTNPAYVQGALDWAAAIYRGLPAVPDLLRIDGYSDEEPAESLLPLSGSEWDSQLPMSNFQPQSWMKMGIPMHKCSFTGISARSAFNQSCFFGKSFWGTSAAGTALCPASIWLGRGRSSTICTMTVGWMCWAAHRSCYCLSIINFMTGSWNTIWRRLTRCSLQQKNDRITEKETLLWDLTFTPGR